MARHLRRDLSRATRGTWHPGLFSSGAVLPLYGLEGQDVSRRDSPCALAAANCIRANRRKQRRMGGGHQASRYSGRRFVFPRTESVDLELGARRLNGFAREPICWRVMPPPMEYLFAMWGYPRGADDLQRAYWLRFHPKGRFFQRDSLIPLFPALLNKEESANPTEKNGPWDERDRKSTRLNSSH